MDLVKLAFITKNCHYHSIIPLWPTQVVMYISSSIIFIAGWWSMVLTYSNLFNHPPTEGHLDCFQFWTITNNSCYKHSCKGFQVDRSFFLMWYIYSGLEVSGMEAGRALWLLVCLGSNEAFTHNTGYRALGLEMGRLTTTRSRQEESLLESLTSLWVT